MPHKGVPSFQKDKPRTKQGFRVVKVVVYRCKIEREEFGKGVACVVCAQVEEECTCHVWK